MYLAVMQSYRIRPATSDDATEIARIHIQSWHDTYSSFVHDSFLQSLSPSQMKEKWLERIASALQECWIYVATCDDRPVGFIYGGAAREDISGYEGELYAIYLDQLHHRRGVGEQLVRCLAQDFYRADMSGMYVCVLRDNPCKPFYYKLGAELIKYSKLTLGDRIYPEEYLGWVSCNDLL